MADGYKVFAVITVVGGKPVVGLNDNRYKVVTTKDGAVCIVEKKTQEYFPMDNQKSETEVKRFVRTIKLALLRK